MKYYKDTWGHLYNISEPIIYYKSDGYNSWVYTDNNWVLCIAHDLIRKYKKHFLELSEAEVFCEIL